MRSNPEQEGDAAEARAEQRDSSPASKTIDCRGGDRAERTADRVEYHVTANKPAARFGTDSEDQALVGDVNGLNREVEQDDTEGQRCERTGQQDN